MRQARPHPDFTDIFIPIPPTRNFQKALLFFEDTPWNGTYSRNALKMEDEALATISESSREENGDHFPLQFVTTVSVNIPSKAEQTRNQKIIRQTVMKNFRQQQKSEKIKLKGRSNRLAAALSSNATGEEFEIDAPSSSTFWTSSRSQSSSWSESDSKEEVRYNKSRQCSLYALQTSPVLDSPLTPLGAGRIDPFRSYSADNNSHMHELVDHCEYHLLSNSQLSVCVHSATTNHVYPQPSPSCGPLFDPMDPLTNRLISSQLGCWHAPLDV